MDVVDKAGYDGCDGSSASENHSDGDTEMELKTVAPKYFICPTPGHYINGMKLAIEVIAVASLLPSDRTHEAESALITLPPPHPPLPSSSVASRGLVNHLVVVGMSLVLPCIVWVMD